MNSGNNWTEQFSKKNNLYYYFNSKDNQSLWKVESPEKGWGKTLLDNKHPERGEKYINIYTGRIFYSETEFKAHIQRYEQSKFAPMSKSMRNLTPAMSIEENEAKKSIKRNLPDADSFSSLGQGTTSLFTAKMNKADDFVSLATESSGVSNEAQQFYNKTDKTLEERKQSELLHLRNLNNWIKYTLIRDYCKERSRVLDLACGKGGDLKKWKGQRIQHYAGIDIADGSIHDAVKRFKEMVNPGFSARFAIGNLGTCDLSKFLNIGEVFDVASCQFAMHYMFEKEEWIRNFLSNLSKYLVPGGYFIATLSDGNAIARIMRNRSHKEENNYVWRNPICCISMSEEQLNSLDTIDEHPYGNGYHFTLSESVDNVQEYIATTKLITQLCQEYDLELVRKVNFHEYIHEMLTKKDKESFVRMKVPNMNGGLTVDEMEVAQVYCILVLRKMKAEEDLYATQDIEDTMPLGKSYKQISEDDIVNLL